MDADGKNVRQLTNAPGCYNGGPFFSPDGKRVIFRSDRKKKDHLQLYVINTDGTGERALTDDLNWVHWAPVLAQGRQAHRLHGRRPQQPDGAAQLRHVLDERGHGKENAADPSPRRGRAAGVQPGRQEADVDLDPRPATGPQLWIADFTPPRDE